ncbi:GNAT family N-acetyltransferase [Lacinutrix undariae]
MSENNIVIREISTADDIQIAEVIRSVLMELGAPKVGTAYEDEALFKMTETYKKLKGAYFVVLKEGKVIGGAGISKLDDVEGETCELQKMYFLPEARGIGMGAKLMAVCLQKAKDLGFTYCYLETLPYMKGAKKLYAKTGFKNLEAPLGNTGHHACNVWMLKTL